MVTSTDAPSPPPGEPADDGRPSATILPFPDLHALAGRARLTRSLAALDKALEEQRQAVQLWRETNLELSRRVASLHDSLSAIDRSLSATVALAAERAAVYDSETSPPSQNE